ncbi:MAG: DUF1572 family protein [Phycisphaerae bacterium]
MHPTSIADLLTRAVAAKFRQDLSQIVRCSGILTTEELWTRPNEHCNSVASLILHLTGNITQWVIAGLHGESFDRDRPAEFAAREQRPASEIVPPLESAVARVTHIIGSLTADQLVARYSIQGYDVSGVDVVYHVGEHFAFHTGQIVHITKAIRNVDLSLYDQHGRLRGVAGGKPYENL